MIPLQKMSYSKDDVSDIVVDPGCHPFKKSTDVIASRDDIRIKQKELPK